MRKPLAPAFRDWNPAISTLEILEDVEHAGLFGQLEFLFPQLAPQRIHFVGEFRHFRLLYLPVKVLTMPIRGLQNAMPCQAKIEPEANPALPFSPRTFGVMHPASRTGVTDN